MLLLASSDVHSLLTVDCLPGVGSRSLSCLVPKLIVGELNDAVNRSFERITVQLTLPHDPIFSLSGSGSLR